jgi:guanine deaminase
VHSTEIHFMERAIELAAQNVISGLGGPFGCVVVKGRAIIAEGANAVRSANDPTAHAEIVAIRRATQALGTYALASCTLFTSCEPCPMCLGAAYWARLDSVYFATTRADAKAAGFDDDYFYEEIVKPISARSLKMMQLRTPSCQRPFDEWKISPFKETY